MWVLAFADLARRLDFVLYALATLYVAVKYQEVRKFLAGGLSLLARGRVGIFR